MGELLRVPVVAHVMTVGMIVQRAGWDDETVAAALLHDALEDADRHGRTLRRERLHALVGETVTARVEAVTETKLDDEGRFRTWRDRKEGYLATLRRAAPEAVAVSLADKLHNLWSINEALARGQDVFTTTPARRGLSAGPEQQRWFHRAVLDASRTHDDPRLAPLRTRLVEELDRFDVLTGRGGV